APPRSHTMPPRSRTTIPPPALANPTRRFRRSVEVEPNCVLITCSAASSSRSRSSPMAETRLRWCPWGAAASSRSGDWGRWGECGSQRVGVGHGLLGGVIDGRGRAMDEGGAIAVEQHYPLHCAAPDAILRRRIDAPLSVGVRSINAMLTAGLGQRVGVFAGTG